jgi:hypothetical protein
MTRMTRRAVLGSASRLGVYGAFAASLPARLLAAEEAGSESDILLTVLYPNAPKASFDARRYEQKHIPLVKSLFGPSVERIELRVPHKSSGRKAGISNGPSQVPMGPPSAVLAAASIWIKDLKSFAATSVTANAQVLADLKEVTDSEPIIQYDRVVSLLGEDSAAIKDGSDVFSTYFPTQSGATFNAKYYGEKVIPLMVQLYGPKAIRRVQFTVGVKQGEAAPAVAAAAHFYIKDHGAWDAAGMQAFGKLAAEAPNYTTVRPWNSDAEIAAVG